LHRRGYRFILPVDGPRTPGVAQAEQPPTDVAPIPSVREKFKSWQNSLALTLAVALAVLAAFWRSPSVPRVRATEQLTDDGVGKSSLVTDGNRIYYTTNVGTKNGIAQVSVRGGQPATMDFGIVNPALHDLSADLSELVVVEQNTAEGGSFNRRIWAIPLP